MYFSLLNNFAAAKLLKEHLTGLIFNVLSLLEIKNRFRSGLAKTNQRQRINRFFFLKSLISFPCSPPILSK